MLARKEIIFKVGFHVVKDATAFDGEGRIQELKCLSDFRQGCKESLFAFQRGDGGVEVGFRVIEVFLDGFLEALTCLVLNFEAQPAGGLSEFSHRRERGVRSRGIVLKGLSQSGK